ncbi:MAG TPA: polysaccharide deacetylase [Cyanobacteria bacterium UBA12227]|nr:polysaccharide deacetylase [Cyanobacteria bacterium UBA12227]HAX88927.1 polysaccharide deacetylase [Cyanobacteria bacterium UBA11370]HBY75999.1 polysaccharide deacetylase [Cyanobacteria bacterium UBA11148]
MLRRLKKAKKVLIGLLLVALVMLGAGSLIDQWLFKVPIFGFHNIIAGRGGKESYLDYTQSDLEKFLNPLVEGNYWFLDADSLYRYFLTKSQPIPAEHRGQKPVMITFDDGWKSMKTYVLPTLEKIEARTNKKVKIVLFVNPNSVKVAETGKPPHRSKKYINCSDIKEGFEKGYFDIQGHGFSHKKLTTLGIDDLKAELSQGKDFVKNCLIGLNNTETVMSHLAYAYNKVNRRVRKYAAQYYLSGYLYNNETLRLGWWSDPYRIPRLRVYKQDRPEKLIKLAAASSPIK